MHTLGSTKERNTSLICDGVNRLQRFPVNSAFAIMGDGVKSASDKLNYYAYSTIKAPDKGEVGGSSPSRPTIQIPNKYAAILTFPFQGTCHQKTILPKICQKFE